MELIKKLDYKVYPSEETSISVLTDDQFGGAYLYFLQQSEDGLFKYNEDNTTIRFVKKNKDSTIDPGVQEEQLIYILMDRLEKMNKQYPSNTYLAKIAALNLYLKACKDLVNSSDIPILEE